MFDWVPQFVVNFMSSKALTDATGWVKKFSEAEYAKMEPASIESKKEKRRWAGGWFLKPKNEPPEEEEECVEEPVEVQRKMPTPVGLTRYALITSVFSLSVYNVHLYLSQ